MRTDNWTALFIIVPLLFVVVLFLRFLIRSGKEIIVFETHHALEFINGKFKRVLPAGRYEFVFLWNRLIVQLPKADQILSTQLQDVTSADQLAYRLNATLEYRIVDPLEAYNDNYVSKLYHRLSVALTRLAAGRTLEAVMANRAECEAELLSLVGASAHGCEIKAVNIMSIMLPPELRRLTTEVARARFEAQAALERARGEHAALRSLANAARMLKDNPDLMNLRLLQAMAQGKGSTIVLNQASPLPPGVRPNGARGEDEAEVEA